MRINIYVIIYNIISYKMYPGWGWNNILVYIIYLYKNIYICALVKNCFCCARFTSYIQDFSPIFYLNYSESYSNPDAITSSSETAWLKHTSWSWPGGSLDWSVILYTKRLQVRSRSGRWQEQPINVSLSSLPFFLKLINTSLGED